jgi:hypothetical protein
MYQNKHEHKKLGKSTRKHPLWSTRSTKCLPKGQWSEKSSAAAAGARIAGCARLGEPSQSSTPARCQRA